MKEIPLTQGEVTLVDDEDFEYLNQWKWYAHKSRNTCYAVRMSPQINGKRYRIFMHHEIIGRPPKGMVNDHINGQYLDNGRKNLRHVTIRQNCQNRKNQKKTSQYPGIDWHKRGKKWRAVIQVNGKFKHLGLFINEQNAFDAYQCAINALGETMIGE